MPSTNITLASLFDGNLKVKPTNVDASVPNLVSDTSGPQDNNLLKIDLHYPLETLDTANLQNDPIGADGRCFQQSQFPLLWSAAQISGWYAYGADELTLIYNGASQSFTGVTWNVENWGGNWLIKTQHAGIKAFIPDGASNVTVQAPASVGTGTVKGLIPDVDLTGIGSQTFLDNGINGIKDSSPTTFDTLGEIASSLPTSENVSAYINLNTGSRLHALIGDGTTTDFSVTHKSGNIDVFVDGVLRVPQLSDSASGATTVLSSYDYHSMPGLVSYGTGQTIVDWNNPSTSKNFQRSEFPDFWDWCATHGNPFTTSTSEPLTFEYNGATATFTGIWLGSYDNYPYGYGDVVKANNHGGLNGFLPAGGGATITIYGEATSPSSASGESCPKIVFQDAPNAGQVITVKTY